MRGGIREEAAGLGYAPALYRLGLFYNRTDPAKAPSYFKRAAALDHGPSMYVLGVFDGLESLEGAHRWWEAGAAKGDERCQAGLVRLDRIVQSDWRRLVYRVNRSLARLAFGLLVRSRASLQSSKEQSALKDRF